MPKLVPNPLADRTLGTNADLRAMISQPPSHTRRALLVGLAALGSGGALATILAYPPLELARLWYDMIGVDVSNHQGDVDWQALAASNVAFAYMKATEGADFRDKRIQLNWDGARRPDLCRGAYHFFTQCRSGAEQAKNFIATVPREPGVLPPVIDAEHMGPCRMGQIADVVEEVTAFLNTLEATTAAVRWSTPTSESTAPRTCTDGGQARGSGCKACFCRPSFERANG